MEEGYRTKVVRADLEGLIPPHDKTDLLAVLVFEQPDIPCAPLLPLLRSTVKAEEFRAPNEEMKVMSNSSRNSSSSSRRRKKERRRRRRKEEWERKGKKS